MPPLDNPRREIYAQGLAAGKRQTDAYREAGYKYDATKNRRSPSVLAKKADIVGRVAELLREREVVNQQALQIAIKDTGISKGWIMERLKENVERAMTLKPVFDNTGEYSGMIEYNGHVANKALELLGREIGMFVERHELTLAQKLADMPEDKRAAEMFELVERAKARLAVIRAAEGKVIEGEATEVEDGEAEE